MTNLLSRRQLIQTSVSVAAVSLMPYRAWAGIDDIPRSSFDGTTTADQVAEGMDLTGKTALITGVNSGIGYETMRVLAAKGAHVIGAARTMEKAKTACDSVEGKTTPVVCELTNFENVAACADTVKAMGEPLDMLICNAGIMALPKLEQVNGIEKQFVVNHLGHYVLSRRLLPQVEAAPEARIVMLSSVGYRNAPKVGIEFDNLSGERDYSGFKMYGQTKLANHLHARELARRYSGTNVTANSVHPGFVRTNLGRYFMPKRPEGAPEPTMSGGRQMKDPNQGAATSVYVATHENLNGVSGYYFADCNPEQTVGPHMEDDALALKLWDVSEDLTKDYIA